MEINGKCQHLIDGGLCYLVNQPCFAFCKNLDSKKENYQRTIAANCPGTDLTETDKLELIYFRRAGYFVYGEKVKSS